jgi:hypothetical protein|eukprot:SAG25_NODE_5_length_29351_cov_43.404335_38_plen_142_part_00
MDGPGAGASAGSSAGGGEAGGSAEVRGVMRPPTFEWVCETRRQVLVTLILRWRAWTGLEERPTTLTHLVCLHADPEDDQQLGVLHRDVYWRTRRARAAARTVRAHAPGEQPERGESDGHLIEAACSPCARVSAVLIPTAPQ